jgi:hypothetical protein
MRSNTIVAPAYSLNRLTVEALTFPSAKAMPKRFAPQIIIVMKENSLNFLISAL